MDFNHIALVGLGLIASSIALNLKSKKNRIKITGYSRTKKTREEARKINFCTVCDNYEDCIKEANLVILCVPVGAMGDTMEKITPYLSKSAIVTDVGSVKESVILEVQKKLPKGVFFVPAHPLAGTENSGPSAGFASLFENRWCILTPSKNVPIEIIKKVKFFWEQLGSNVVEMDAKHHDLVLSVTSHAPHLIAFTMVGVADEFSKVTNSEVINYSAAGFRDFTRLAASDPIMWRDVFLNNKDAALEILGRFTEELFTLQKAIRKKDGEYLLKYFERTRKIRRSIISAGQDTAEPNFGRKE
jgi:cyclohexadieny/prephenate dehydrogenase